MDGFTQAPQTERPAVPRLPRSRVKAYRCYFCPYTSTVRSQRHAGETQRGPATSRARGVMLNHLTREHGVHFHAYVTEFTYLPRPRPPSRSCRCGRCGRLRRFRSPMARPSGWKVVDGRSLKAPMLLCQRCAQPPASVQKSARRICPGCGQAPSSGSERDSIKFRGWCFKPACAKVRWRWWQRLVRSSGRAPLPDSLPQKGGASVNTP